MVKVKGNLIFIVNKHINHPGVLIFLNNNRKSQSVINVYRFVYPTTINDYNILLFRVPFVGTGVFFFYDKGRVA